MIDLTERLGALGDELDLPDDRLVDDVLAAIDAPRRSVITRPTGRRALRIAAVVLLATGVVVLAIPDSRRTVAGWFGFDGVSVERRADLDPPPTTSPLDEAAGELVDADGIQVLVTTIDAELDIGLARKTVGPGSNVVETRVAGRPALWIDGEPHVVMLIAPDGSVVDERIAGNTLLWQDGDVVQRVEGFDRMDDAVAFASQR